ncbi:MAG: hypothetical protein BWY86_00490 [Candidatus Aminicenantes bacterium ADurb.Bin508]|nr:MAG: hypothetical protein BWY86_00490 [Candidatus Aminicenantes bacterium ADurb.Bin508]
MLQVGGHGRDKAVGHENPQEGSHQSRADGVAKHCRGLIDLPHGQDDAQDGGDDTEAREGIPHPVDAVGGDQRLFMVGFDFDVHEILQFMGREGAGDDNLEVVAHEGQSGAVLGEVGKLVEERALLRVLHIGFQGDEPLLLHLGEELEEHG